MGRIAFGVDKVMKEILKLVGDGLSLERPIEELMTVTQLGKATVVKYLKELNERKFVEFVFGDRWSIRKLSIKKKEIPTLITRPLLPPPSVPSPSSVPVSVPIPVSAPAPVVVPVGVPTVNPVARLQLANVVALVDYDNAFIGARDAGFNLSFSRLKDFLRGFGNLIFSDVFIPPYATRRAEVVGILDQAGYQIIACPMASKDKDAVDSKLKWRAFVYLSLAEIEEVVIVSRDQDFRDLEKFAADRHKKVRFVDVVREREKIQGYDGQVQLIKNTFESNYERAVGYLASGNLASLTNDEQQRVDLLKDIILTIADRPNADNEKMDFRMLQRYIWLKIYQKWNRSVPESHLEYALSALLSDRVLIDIIALRSVFYTLNRNHHIVMRLLATVSHRLS